MTFEVQMLNPSQAPSESPENIIIKENGDYDSLTRVTIDDGVNIYIYWKSSWNGGATFETLAIPEEYTLFIGAGCLSIQVNLNNSTIIRVRNVLLFEYFSKYENFILEHCDAECTAFSLNGEILNHHELDMMWTIDHRDGYLWTIDTGFHGERKLVKL